jgi:CBS domain-containing membrane protein
MSHQQASCAFLSQRPPFVVLRTTNSQDSAFPSMHPALGSLPIEEKTLTQFAQAFGPAVGRVPWKEAVRAGIGALIGLGVTGLFLLSPSIDLQDGLFLIAPFGASAVLLFAVPNSPLAQPWSAIIGNVVAALVAVAVCYSIQDEALKVGLAVGGAITAMMLCRAMHPPGGAVAMTAALSPAIVEKLGFWYALMPVGLGTGALVIIAMGYAHLTGRKYPFRQFDDPNKHGTSDRNPSERLDLSKDELADILSKYRQSFNLGVEDLARLIGAAEMRASAHRSADPCVGDIMSTDLISVAPDTPVTEILELFKRHHFTALPVVRDDEEFVGIIFQIDVINHFNNSLVEQLGRITRKAVTASHIMQHEVPQVSAASKIVSLFPLMADGEVDAVPVLDGKTIVGIVTQTDLIAALARLAIRAEDT